MKSSIIIPTFNRLIFTRICVQFLVAMFANNDDVELIIVDNGSSDGTPDFLRTLPPPFRVVLNRTNRSFATACNQGANVSTGEILVFLNNDTVPTDGWLEPLLQLLACPGIGIVGPKLLFPDGTIQHAGVVVTESYIPAHMYYLFPGDYPEANVEREYQAVTGACLAMRRSLFQRLGGFDEEYRNSFEDIDLCLRARVMGLRVMYTPRSVVYHFESVSEGRHDRDEANRIRFLGLWKHYVTIDEPVIYRNQGFMSIPRLPVRTLPQALTQMQLEGRRADSMSRLVSSFERLEPLAGERADTRELSLVPFMVGPVPEVLTAGAEISLNLLLVDRRAGRLSPATLRYAWRRPGQSPVFWSGNAAQLPAEGGIPSAVKATIVVPTVLGQYELQWAIVQGDSTIVVSNQLVTVASQYGIECRARLPPLIHAGQYYRVIVKLKNHGSQPLLAHGGFHLSYHWYDAMGKNVIQWEGARTLIHERLAYGEETIVEANVQAPSTSGRYTFAWDAVSEGQFWFSDAGTPLRLEAVDIQPAGADDLSDQSRDAIPQGAVIDRRDIASERNARNLSAALRAREIALETAIQDLTVQQNYADDLMRRLGAQDIQIKQLNQHLRQVERGKIMRLLNRIARWRQGLFPIPPGRKSAV